MDFDAVYETLPATGWLTRDEARLLWDAARETTGSILECGVYHGRSTVLLAALGRPVYAVDPFAGFDSDDPTGEKTYRAFWTNLTGRTISLAELAPGPKYPCRVFLTPKGRVTLYRQRVEEWTTLPCGFAYLDGQHDYAGTVAQIEVARVCGAAAVGVHDCNDDGGGREVKRACLELLGPWRERVGRLAVWRLT